MDQDHVGTSLHDYGPLPISLVADSWFKRTKEIWTGEQKRHVLSTGYRSLDAVVGGLYNGMLTLLAARPSVGKTSLAVNIARSASALLASQPHSEISSADCVVFFSLEMSKEMLMNNIMSQESQVGVKFFRERVSVPQKIAAQYYGAIDKAMDRIEKWPMLIDDESRLLSRMEARLQTISQLWNPRLIIVDYLQHMEPENVRDSRNEAMGHISRGLKAIAKVYDCPVLALSQLSRAALYDNGHQIPDLQHLRDSGSLEQDADNVWFLWKPDYHQANLVAPEERGIIYVLVAKQRQGPRQVKVPLVFHDETTRFIDCPKALYDTLEKSGKLEYYPDTGEVTTRGYKR